MVIWGSDLMYWLPVASQTPGKETHLEGIQRDTEIGMVEGSFLSLGKEKQQHRSVTSSLNKFLPAELVRTLSGRS